MNPSQIATLTECTIKGMPTREIAPIIGVSHTTVSRTQQKPDIKAKVEAGITKLINRGLNPSINTLCRFAAMGNTKSIVYDKDMAKLSIDASKVILSHANGSGPQTIINQLIYSQGTHTQTDPASLEMINRALGISQEEDVIDVNPA